MAVKNTAHVVSSEHSTHAGSFLGGGAGDPAIQTASLGEGTTVSGWVEVRPDVNDLIGKNGVIKPFQ
jgi:hypothetical protein